MRRTRKLCLALCTALALGAGAQLGSPAQASTTATSGDGASLAVTPPMGWNNWAQFGCTTNNPDPGDAGPSESLVKAQAQALVSSGLAAKGYNTLTIDDCWMQPSRDANGNLVANPSLFPDGMAALGTYLHGLGLKFGIYEDAGISTCGGYPGSGIQSNGGPDHFAQDAKLFASWGVDYLKLDGCGLYIPPGETQQQAYQNAYAAESAALRASGRDIVFSESADAYFIGSQASGSPDPGQPVSGRSSYNAVLGWLGQYGQLWREGWDVATYNPSAPTTDRFSSVLNNYSYNSLLARYSGPGDWNDPDFLIPGEGMSVDETRSQIALWAMMSAPLILSTDVTTLSSQSISDLGNSGIVAIDQDSLGEQGSVISSNGTTDILAKSLSNGDRAVALFNDGSTAETVSTSTAAIGLTGGSGCTYTVTDEWAGTSSTSSGTITATIPSHGTAIYRVSPAAGCGTVVPVGQILGQNTSGGGVGHSTCIDDSGSGTTDGNPIIIYGCSGNANQQWTAGADGTVRTLGKCMSALNGGTVAGTQVVLSTCSGSAGQTWTYERNGNLVNNNSGLCLEVSGGGNASGTDLDTGTCGDNQLNQIWAVPVNIPRSNADTVTVTNPGTQIADSGTSASLQISASDSASGQRLTYTAVNLPPGLSINDMTGAITGTAVPLGTWTPTVTVTDNAGASGSTSFTWTVNANTALAGTHVVSVSGQALEDPGNSSTAAQQVDTSAISGGSDQNWTFTLQANGAYTLVNGASKMCLDDSGSGTSAGTAVIQYPCSGNENQEWIIASVSGGAYTITNAYSSLSATTASTSNGALVTQQANSGSALQQWTIK